MTQKTDSESFDSQQKPRHTLLGDAKVLKERFEEETRGTSSALPPHFSFTAALLLFWGYYAVLATAGFILVRSLIEWPQTALLYAALPIFLAGNFEIAAVYFCKKKFGPFIEMTVSSAVRTGIPLVAVLVYYFTIDKMLLKPAVLTLFGFYVLTLPFEVWIFLPRSKAGRNDSVITQTKDERINNGG